MKNSILKNNDKFIQVSNCPICNSDEIKQCLFDVKDNVIDAVDYVGNIYKCKKCGHGFLSPILEKNYIHKAYSGYYTQKKDDIGDSLHSVKIKDRFTLFIDFYRHQYKGIKTFKGKIINLFSYITPFARFFLFRAVRFLAPANETAKLRLLDVGCGSGDFLIRSASCGYDVHGIDFDPETVEIAKSRGLRNVFVGELNAIPKSQKFDVITLSHVIEHVYDPQSLISEIFERLKPGGYFYLATPNFNSAGRYAFKNNWRGCDVPRHMHFFNNSSLKNLLISSGFNDVRQVYDIMQSVGVIRSSFKIQSKEKSSRIKNIITVFNLFKNNMFSSDNLEVSVFKCYKS